MSATVPAYDGLSTKQYSATLSLVIAFGVVATAAILARLASRSLKRLSSSLNDCLITVLLVLYWSQTATEIIRAKKGFARASSVASTRSYYQVSIADDVLFAFVVTAARLSAITTATGMFSAPSKRVWSKSPPRLSFFARLLSFASLGWIAAWSIYAVLISTLQCTPLSALWSSRDARDQQCLDVVAVTVSTMASSTMCTVLTIAAITLIMLETTSTKSSKATIVSMGLLAAACLGVEAARLAVAAQLDPSRSSRSTFLFYMLEPAESGLLIVAACLMPYLRLQPPPASLTMIYGTRQPASKRQRARALRDRVLIGKDTYNARHYPTYRPFDDTTGLTIAEKGMMPFGGGLAQVHAAPVMMPRSAWDPLPRASELGRCGRDTSYEIQVEQEVQVEMEHLHIHKSNIVRDDSVFPARDDKLGETVWRT